MKNKVLTLEIPYLFWHKNIVINQDGSFFCGIKLDGKDIFSSNLNELRVFKEKVFSVFSKLPVGTKVQFLHFYHDDIADDLAVIKKSMSESSDVKKYFKNQFFDYLQHSNISKKVELYCFITHPNQIKNNEFFKSKKVNLLSKFKKNKSSYSLNQFKKEIEGFSEQAKNVVFSMKEHLNVNANLLTEESFKRICYKILNPGKIYIPNFDKSNENHKVYDLKTLRDSFVHSDIQIFSDRLKINKFFYKLIEFRFPPSSTYPSDSDEFLNALSFPCIWSFDFKILDNGKINSKLAQRQKYKFARTANDMNPDYQSVHSKSEIEKALFDQKEQGFSWCDVSMGFLISDENLNSLQKKYDLLCDRFSMMNDIVLKESKYNQFKSFLDILPGHAQEQKKWHLMNSSNVNDLIPISAPNIGTKDFATYFHTYRDTLFRFSTFSEEYNNWNQIVIGQTGSGKSFIVNTILMRSLMSMKKPQVMILDLGKSFKKITDFWGGDYVVIDLDNPDQGLNPLPPHESIFSEGTVQSLGFLDFTINLIQLMCGFESQKELQPRILRKSLFATYKKSASQTPILSDLKMTLANYHELSNDNEDIELAKTLSKLLEEYTEGAYSKIFNRRSKFTISSDFFCFDFKDAHSNPKIREISTYIIGGYFTQKMTNNSDHKFIVIDEFATTMQHETGALLCKMIAKNCRKHGVSFICISQELEDFLYNPAAQAVYNQANFKWFLRMNDNLKIHADHLRLSERDINIIQSLQTKKGEYSQIYLNYGDRKTLLYLRPDPMTYWLCTNDAKDNKMTQYYLNQGHSYFETVKILSEKFPQGVRQSDLDSLNL